ncbi:MAG: esterase family protein, partial [Chloroflexi bacterium]|nr:esterase family protein [Chloroflexota bacterium]
HAEAGKPLAIRQSCGTEDFLYATNLAFHRHLKALGIAHEWVEHPGAHDQATWDVQLPLALDFVLQRLL